MALTRVSAGGLVVASPINDDVDFDNAADYGVSAVATTVGTDTTVIATHANMTGTGSTTSFTFTKVRSDTRVRLDMSVSWFVTGAAACTELAMRANSVDYVLGLINQTNGPVTVAALWAWIGPGVLAAGTYTVQARWRRVSGAGTPSRSTQDWLAMRATEVW